MRQITEIVIHCSDTPPGWMDKANVNDQRAEMASWHVAKGWRGIGYHWVIGRRGDEAIGRDLDGDGDPWEHVGAGVRGHNAHTIHICLIGGHGSTQNDAFADNFTLEQEVALRRRIAALRKQFPSIKRVSGHNEYAAKACPGFNVPRWYASKQERTIAQSKTAQGAGLALLGLSLEPAFAVIDAVAADPSWVTGLAAQVGVGGQAVAAIGAGLALWSRWRDWTVRGRR